MEHTTVLHCTVFLSNMLCNTTASRPIQSKKRQHFSKRSNTSGVSLILWACSACYNVSLRLAGCHDLLSVSCADQASQESSSSTSSNRFPASLAFPSASWLGREWPCPQNHHLNLCHNIINPSALIKLHENYHHHMISHNIINLFSTPIKLWRIFKKSLTKRSSHNCYYLFSSLYASITNHKRLFSGVPHCMFGRIKGRQIWTGGFVEWRG